MSISKRLRFEILRRDNHACRYCGATAPEAELQVDHVVPEALGGSDQPSNLVAACKDCNRGKASVPADAPLVEAATVFDRTFREMLRLCVARSIEEHRAETVVVESIITAVERAWGRWSSDGHEIDHGDFSTIVNAYLRLGDISPSDVAELLCSLVDVAMRRSGVRAKDRFRYFCGVAWNRHRELVAEAGALAVAHSKAVLSGQN